ncbi:MAG: maleylpyruvate isomerase family mycothiol-dependent enzyme [Pseudonocardia sediminis]
MTTVLRNRTTLRSDLGVMQREAGMAMATIASLTDTELARPSGCDGWTRAHVIAHLTRDADAMTRLATWAVTGEETPDYASPEERDAGIRETAELPAAQLAAGLERADARLVTALRALGNGVRVETVPTLVAGEIDVFSLPARRTTELIVHHGDLGTTWKLHEAGPDAMVDGIEVCVDRLQAHPDGPGLQVVAREGEEWTVGDGGYRIEGYYETLLPFLARGRADDGLRHEGELPRLPAW